MLVVILPMMLSAHTNSASRNIEEEADTLYNWSVTDVEYLREHKGEFANKKMSDLSHFFLQRNMKIGGVWGKGTSPWNDPYHKGKSYVRNFYIYSRDFDNLVKGDDYYKIDVILNLPENDTTIVFGDFWRSFDRDKSEIEQFFQKTKDLPIKSLELTRKTYIGHP